MVEIVREVKFGYDSLPETERLLRDFRKMLNFCLDKTYETKSFSIKALHHACYNELKARYDYDTQYFISAMKTAVSRLRFWKWVKRRKPRAGKLINFPPLLTRFEGDRLTVSVKPGKFIVIPLKFEACQEKFIRFWKKGKLKAGEIQMDEHWITITFKQEIDLKKLNECILLDMDKNFFTIDFLKNRLNGEEKWHVRRILRLILRKRKKADFSRLSGAGQLPITVWSRPFERTVEKVRRVVKGSSPRPAPSGGLKFSCKIRSNRFWLWFNYSWGGELMIIQITFQKIPTRKLLAKLLGKILEVLGKEWKSIEVKPYAHLDRTYKGPPQDLARKVLERDKYTCVLCGGRAEEVHHKVPKAEGGVNHPNNLMSVCKACHLWLHKRLYKKRKLMNRYPLPGL